MVTTIVTKRHYLGYDAEQTALPPSSGQSNKKYIFLSHKSLWALIFIYSYKIKQIHRTNNMPITQDIYPWLQFWHTTHRNTRTKRHESRPNIIWPHLFSIQHTPHILCDNEILLCFPKILNFCGARIKPELLSSGQAISPQCYHIKLPELYHPSESIWKKQLQGYYLEISRCFKQQKQFTNPSRRPCVQSGIHKISLTLDLDEQHRGDIKLHRSPPRQWLRNKCRRYIAYDFVNLIWSVSKLPTLLQCSTVKPFKKINNF